MPCDAGNVSFDLLCIKRGRNVDFVGRGDCRLSAVSEKGGENHVSVGEAKMSMTREKARYDNGSLTLRERR